MVVAAGDDDEFEARIAALKKAKGETPFGEGKKGSKEEGSSVKTGTRLG